LSEVSTENKETIVYLLISKKASHGEGGVATTLWVGYCFEGVID